MTTRLVIVPDKQAPKGWACDVCRLAMKPGDKAFMLEKTFKKETTALDHDVVVKLAWHYECMIELPLDSSNTPDKIKEMEQLREQYAEAISTGTLTFN